MRDDYLLYLHRSMELYPLYSQCFLTFGMSFERWVCVCRPHNAKQILNKQNRLWLIFGTSVLSVGVPSAFFADLIYHKDQNCFLKNIRSQVLKCYVEYTDYMLDGRKVNLYIFPLDTENKGSVPRAR